MELPIALPGGLPIELPIELSIELPGGLPIELSFELPIELLIQLLFEFDRGRLLDIIFMLSGNLLGAFWKPLHAFGCLFEPGTPMGAILTKF